MKLNFDSIAFERLAASLDGVFSEIVDVFFQETEISLVDLRSSIKEKKQSEVNGIAHKIKSSIKTFGAIGLVEILEKIEITESADENIELHKLLETEYFLVKELIKEKIK